MNAAGRRWLCLALLQLTTLLLASCTRAHYREAADRETYPILAEREIYPQYDAGRVDLSPPPASRLFDPFDPDRPPLPPDDPAASIFMQRPGGLKGSPYWEEDGVTNIIEGPNWRQALTFDENGVAQFDQNTTVEIALLNNREYQLQLEQLYLSALSLTLNRFEFDLQWFGSNITEYRHFGSGGVPNGESNQLTSNSNVGFTKNFAWGGQLLADFSNSLVMEFTGDGFERWSSNILLRATQPLLRGFGRKVRLESLTQAERNVLYQLRTFVRFRKEFWANTAIQGGGYLDLLLAQQTIRNNQSNLVQQQQTYRLYNELFAGGRASAVARDQFFQSLQSARLAVIQSETALANQLDQYKLLRLGLPPRLPMEIDDSFLERFQLVQPELETLRGEIEIFQQARLAELDQPVTVESLQAHYDQLDAYAARMPAALDAAMADISRFRQRLREESTPGADGAISPEELEQAQRVFDAVTRQLADAKAEFANLRAALSDSARIVEEFPDPELLATDEARRAFEDRLEAAWETMNADLNDLLSLSDSVISIQTQAKIYTIELPEIEWTEEQALAFARINRLDLQNAQGQVVDAYRKVAVAANALMADFDLVGTANFGTDPDHDRPFNFASEATSYSLGFRLDTPLNRMAERNAYRASLIDYQQARRAYVSLSDLVELQVRRDLRTLTLTRASFEISRQQLLAAARQLESSRITLLGPRTVRDVNDSTTLNLLDALSRLLAARNQIASNYINFEQQRVQLLLDLEALQLDSRGFPTDDSLRFANGDTARSDDGDPERNRLDGAIEEIPPGEPDAAAGAGAEPLGDPIPDPIPDPIAEGARGDFADPLPEPERNEP